MFGLRFPITTAEHTRSYYAATAPGRKRAPLGADIEADVLVVGGGFSGVNTALELAERGVDVVLLEGHRIGWGASGRNGWIRRRERFWLIGTPSASSTAG